MTGLESAKRENYKEAFTCFLAAAEQGYSKAQFNVAVCYDKGRGVRKDGQKVRVQSSNVVLLASLSFLNFYSASGISLRMSRMCFLF